MKHLDGQQCLQIPNLFTFNVYKAKHKSLKCLISSSGHKIRYGHRVLDNILSENVQKSRHLGRHFVILNTDLRVIVQELDVQTELLNKF